jgi:glucose-6-phosphate 1-epimerase
MIDFRGLQALSLRSSDGASAVITCHGAHVVSWIPAGGEERLYMSERSAFQEGLPIRGGVPVVFPQFATYGPLPHHGFARTCGWQMADTSACGDNALAMLRLQDSTETRALWPQAFAAELSVGIGGNQLDIKLHIENTGNTPLDFAAALHTYLRVADVRTVRLDGLRGIRYRDRTQHDREAEDRSEALAISGEVDRIYLDAPKALLLREPHRSLSIRSEGFPDLVVWNPWEAKCAQLADMPDDGFRHMLCIEAAAVASRVKLDPGEHWVGEQTLIALS